MQTFKRFLSIIYNFYYFRLDLILFKCNLFFWKKPVNSNAVNVRLFLEHLGPIFIKFGQILSLRDDFLNKEIIAELEKLQDEVSPFDYDLALNIIEKSLKSPINQYFQYVERKSLASASIAQVHAAKLLNGEDVVVKIIRPGLEDVINHDIKIMKIISKILFICFSETKRLHLDTVIEDFHATLLSELNLMIEAGNLSQFRRNFENSNIFYAPKIYWELCRNSIMVSERIFATRITDVKTLKDSGVNMKKLANLGVHIFFTQVFNYKFFHADMHPGNLFIDHTDSDNPKFIAVDFGIVGSIDDENSNYLAQNLLAFFSQDYRKVAQLHIESSWVNPNTKVYELESAIRSVCEPIFSKPLKDISFGLVLMQLFQVARKFEMEVQPQLVLLEKTLINIESLGRKLYPELDIWVSARPFFESWSKKRFYPKNLAKLTMNNLNNIPKTLKSIQDLSSYLSSQKNDRNYIIIYLLSFILIFQVIIFLK